MPARLPGARPFYEPTLTSSGLIPPDIHLSSVDFSKVEAPRAPTELAPRETTELTGDERAETLKHDIEWTIYYHPHTGQSGYLDLSQWVTYSDYYYYYYYYY